MLNYQQLEQTLNPNSQLSTQGISHIGIAVYKIDKALKFYQNILGFQLIEQKTVLEQGIKVVFLKQNDGCQIELMEPISDDCPVAKFLKKQGEGIQHIAIHVENIEQWIDHLKTENIWVLEETRGISAFGEKIVFLHPLSSHGVVIELIEKYVQVQSAQPTSTN